MNKKIIVITILSIMTGLVIFNIANKKENAIKETEKPITNSNMLTMMIETEAGTGNYEEVTQSEWPQDGYVFNASLSRCENGGTLSWDNDTKKVIMESNTSDKCYVYFDIYVEPTLAELCNEKTLANRIKENVYSVDGVNGIYYHDGVGTYTNADQEAGDNSYRYSGANPNNYICFGTDVETCPNDNLYRIIGVFDDDSDGNYNVKLIKSTKYGNFAWDENENYETTWNAAIKPDIYTTLNESYYNALSSEWQSLINENQIWQVGGINSGKNTVKIYYNAEIKNQTGYEEAMPVGLMYISDYGYAARPDDWTTDLTDYGFLANKNNNWLYLGEDELPISNNTMGMYIVSSGGWLSYPKRFSDIYAVRPSFYLDSNVTLKSGSGSINDPYRLQIT